jgi:hypothetical protein
LQSKRDYSELLSTNKVLSTWFPFGSVQYLGLQ